MNKKTLLLLSSIVVFTALGSAVANTSKFNIENDRIDSTVSVNQFGVNIANISSKYVYNVTNKSLSSDNYDVHVNGNVSTLLDAPSSFTLFNNESNSFPLVANVPESQRFGNYTGNLSMTSSQNLSRNDSVNISLTVVDDIKPEITSRSIESVQATNSVDWSVNAEDNLNVSSVSGKVFRQTYTNGTASGNVTVENFDFNESGTGVYSYTFSKTDVIGEYFLEMLISDESGNTVSETVGFTVDGLDSVNVLSENFVFDTVQAKDETGFQLVENKQSGKEFSISLKNLSYGGNGSVEIGVLPPNGESPEILGNGRRSYSEEGVYELVLIHSGDNEVKGTHRVTGEVLVEKPVSHVKPVNVSSVFSGTVKNLDKPSSTCERVKEFDSCVGYSLDETRKLFDENYGLNSSGEDRSFAYLIGRIPTSDVEGSSSWGDELSLTFGEYNETIETNERQKRRIEELESGIGFRNALLLWMPVLLIGVGGGTMVYYFKVGQYIAFAQNKQKIIEKAQVKEPEEGLN